PLPGFPTAKFAGNKNPIFTVILGFFLHTSLTFVKRFVYARRHSRKHTCLDAHTMPSIVDPEIETVA
ncbi:MAG: hypothetical protein ACREA4_09205, partial [Nitrososphaera sp.]